MISMQGPSDLPEQSNDLYEQYNRGLEESLGDLEGRSITQLPNNLKKLEQLVAARKAEQQRKRG